MPTTTMGSTNPLENKSNKVVYLAVVVIVVAFALAFTFSSLYWRVDTTTSNTIGIKDTNPKSDLITPQPIDRLNKNKK